MDKSFDKLGQYRLILRNLLVLIENFKFFSLLFNFNIILLLRLNLND